MHAQQGISCLSVTKQQNIMCVLVKAIEYDPFMLRKAVLM